MANKEQNEFRPDYAVPPGETLLETIEALGMSQAELADRMGRPRKTINEIIKGKAAITPETAIQLERVLGVPASFWNNLERNYREDLARLEEADRLRAKQEWLAMIPHKDMAAYGWIRATKDPVELAQSVLDFFGVATPEIWKQRWLDPKVAFRKSAVYEAAPGAVAAWLRKGEIEAQRIPCEPFDEQGFKGCLATIRTLTAEPPEIFVPEVSRVCARYGVVVAFVRELPRLSISGATRWLNPDKALIQLSLRYKTDDHLWFTFFHEAGHILRHGKREVFLEDGQAQCRAEEEANAFAADLLIPPTRLNAFVKQGVFTEESVRTFAKQIGIAPGIVVGRLQHDGIIPFDSRLNHLKRKLEWT